MAKRLHEKVAIVTGAAQGIGAAYAHELAAEGAHVCLADVLDCSAAAEAIIASGGQALALRADVTNAAAVADMVQRTTEAFGGIDILINNAAIFASLDRMPFDEISSSDWDRVLTVNTRGPFECTKAVVPALRKRGGGKIVNVASSTFFTGQPGFLHYVASKGAVIAMTRVLARELGADNINVNCIAPGLTMSKGVLRTYGEQNTQPVIAGRALKRLQQPNDLLGTLIFLSSHESDFITGQVIVVDGGGFMH
jgi:NAD(P)-dependent dehydrogenase (short-subunit alcohol dehydrogenase family)